MISVERQVLVLGSVGYRCSKRCVRAFSEDIDLSAEDIVPSRNPKPSGRTLLKRLVLHSPLGVGFVSVDLGLREAGGFEMVV